MLLCVTEIAAIRGATIVTPFPGKGAGGIVQQRIIDRRFLVGDSP